MSGSVAPQKPCTTTAAMIQLTSCVQAPPHMRSQPESFDQRRPTRSGESAQDQHETKPARFDTKTTVAMTVAFATIKIEVRSKNRAGVTSTLQIATRDDPLKGIGGLSGDWPQVYYVGPSSDWETLAERYSRRTATHPSI
jgi:hypothetical protein